MRTPAFPRPVGASAAAVRRAAGWPPPARSGCIGQPAYRPFLAMLGARSGPRRGPGRALNVHCHGGLLLPRAQGCTRTPRNRTPGDASGHRRAGDPPGSRAGSGRQPSVPRGRKPDRHDRRRRPFRGEESPVRTRRAHCARRGDRHHASWRERRASAAARDLRRTEQETAMDWFERLTGFRERGYEETRRRLRVEGGRLHSLDGRRSHGIGALELVSLRTLRERVAAAGGLPGRLKVANVTRRRGPYAPRAGMRRRPVPGRLAVQPAGDDRARGDARARRDALRARPHPGPGLRHRRRRGDDLPQLPRPRGRRHRPDGRAPARRAGRRGRRTAGSPRPAGRRALEHAQRLRAVHPRRARRHRGTPGAGRRRSGRRAARPAAHRRAP